ncbi:hypothetical protein IV203_028070 [Nitzschia inconspicua]|uniref:Transmembrane protein n=1 Tax=Nitzschia inconspicua TaxID=303405 RepID=A0A9K3LXI3_9STRA|nr:hypothetical protein IV203_028070 [Nitzschia inconspicua]
MPRIPVSYPTKGRRGCAMHFTRDKTINGRRERAGFLLIPSFRPENQQENSRVGGFFSLSGCSTQYIAVVVAIFFLLRGTFSYNRERVCDRDTVVPVRQHIAVVDENRVFHINFFASFVRLKKKKRVTEPENATETRVQAGQAF